MPKQSPPPKIQLFDLVKKEREDHSVKRRQIKARHTIKKASSTDSYSRQYSEDDGFENFYGTGLVLQPPYQMARLTEIYETSAILQACVAAYIENIDGFGWEITPKCGVEVDMEVGEMKESPEKKILEDFFSTPNGTESFNSIKKKLRQNFEVTGNAYLEVYRNLKGKPQLLYWMDAQRVRICPLEDKEVDFDVTVLRDGTEVTIRTKKKFRKYAMLYSLRQKTVTSMKISYFKEYGDPRKMNALTGHYEDERDEEADKEWVEATEVIHRKHGTGVYGVPRWIGNILTVLGLSKSEYVNFDLFDSQGIPPMVITVSGGALTEESMTDLLDMFSKIRNADQFNKVLVLEGNADIVGLDGKSDPVKIDYQSLLDYRKDDLMFGKYMEDGRLAVRELGFRLPSLFIGDHEGINYASARIIRETTEEQVFIPIRNSDDEMLNMTIVKDLGVKNWEFKSKAPIIRSNDELIKLIPSLLANGAFTTNELIEFTNQNFGTKLRPYFGEEAEKWQSNVPTPYCYSQLHNFGTSSVADGGELDPQNSDEQDTEDDVEDKKPIEDQKDKPTNDGEKN